MHRIDPNKTRMNLENFYDHLTAKGKMKADVLRSLDSNFRDEAYDSLIYLADMALDRCKRAKATKGIASVALSLGPSFYI